MFWISFDLQVHGHENQEHQWAFRSNIGRLLKAWFLRRKEVVKIVKDHFWKQSPDWKEQWMELNVFVAYRWMLVLSVPPPPPPHWKAQATTSLLWMRSRVRNTRFPDLSQEPPCSEGLNLSSQYVAYDQVPNSSAFSENFSPTWRTVLGKYRLQSAIFDGHDR